MSDTIPLRNEVLQFKESMHQLLELKKQSESLDDPKAKQLLQDKLKENMVVGTDLFILLKRKNLVYYLMIIA